MTNYIAKFEQAYVKMLMQDKEPIPAFSPGDTLRVHTIISEGDKERIQIFEGFCIARKNKSSRSSFTVRKISNGVGVEKTFPLYSINISKIEVVRRGKVRRAKLYYLRDIVGKVRIPEKFDNKSKDGTTRRRRRRSKQKEVNVAASPTASE